MSDDRFPNKVMIDSNGTYWVSEVYGKARGFDGETYCKESTVEATIKEQAEEIKELEDSLDKLIKLHGLTGDKES